MTFTMFGAFSLGGYNTWHTLPSFETNFLVELDLSESIIFGIFLESKEKFAKNSLLVGDSKITDMHAQKYLSWWWRLYSKGESG